MNDSFEEQIFYNPPGIVQSNGFYADSGYPDVENINCGNFSDASHKVNCPRFVTPDMPAFEALRAWCMWAGTTASGYEGRPNNYWTLVCTWGELRQMLE